MTVLAAEDLHRSFAGIPAVRGGTFWQAAFLYGILLLVRGVAAAFEGEWSLSGAIREGDLDRLLLRPLPVLVQLYGSGPALKHEWSRRADRRSREAQATAHDA